MPLLRRHLMSFYVQLTRKEYISRAPPKGPDERQEIFIFYWKHLLSGHSRLAMTMANLLLGGPAQDLKGACQTALHMKPHENAQKHKRELVVWVDRIVDVLKLGRIGRRLTSQDPRFNTLHSINGNHVLPTYHSHVYLGQVGAQRAQTLLNSLIINENPLKAPPQLNESIVTTKKKEEARTEKAAAELEAYHARNKDALKLKLY